MKGLLQRVNPKNISAYFHKGSLWNTSIAPVLSRSHNILKTFQITTPQFRNLPRLQRPQVGIPPILIGTGTSRMYLRGNPFHLSPIPHVYKMATAFGVGLSIGSLSYNTTLLDKIKHLLPIPFSHTGLMAYAEGTIPSSTTTTTGRSKDKENTTLGILSQTLHGHQDDGNINQTLRQVFDNAKVSDNAPLAPKLFDVTKGEYDAEEFNDLYECCVHNLEVILDRNNRIASHLGAWMHTMVLMEKVRNAINIPEHGFASEAWTQQFTQYVDMVRICFSVLKQFQQESILAETHLHSNEEIRLRQLSFGDTEEEFLDIFKAHIENYLEIYDIVQKIDSFERFVKDHHLIFENLAQHIDEYIEETKYLAQGIDRSQYLRSNFLPSPMSSELSKVFHGKGKLPHSPPVIKLDKPTLRRKLDPYSPEVEGEFVFKQVYSLDEDEDDNESTNSGHNNSGNDNV